MFMPQNQFRRLRANSNPTPLQSPPPYLPPFPQHPRPTAANISPIMFGLEMVSLIQNPSLNWRITETVQIGSEPNVYVTRLTPQSGTALLTHLNELSTYVVISTRRPLRPTHLSPQHERLDFLRSSTNVSQTFHLLESLLPDSIAELRNRFTTDPIRPSPTLPQSYYLPLPEPQYPTPTDSIQYTLRYMSYIQRRAIGHLNLANRSMIKLRHFVPALLHLRIRIQHDPDQLALLDEALQRLHEFQNSNPHLASIFGPTNSLQSPAPFGN